MPPFWLALGILVSGTSAVGDVTGEDIDESIQVPAQFRLYEDNDGVLPSSNNALSETLFEFEDSIGLGTMSMGSSVGSSSGGVLAPDFIKFAQSVIEGDSARRGRAKAAALFLTSMVQGISITDMFGGKFNSLQLDKLPKDCFVQARRFPRQFYTQAMPEADRWQLCKARNQKGHPKIPDNFEVKNKPALMATLMGKSALHQAHHSLKDWLSRWYDLDLVKDVIPSFKDGLVEQPSLDEEPRGHSGKGIRDVYRTVDRKFLVRGINTDESEVITEMIEALKAGRVQNTRIWTDTTTPSMLPRYLLVVKNPDPETGTGSNINTHYLVMTNPMPFPNDVIQSRFRLQSHESLSEFLIHEKMCGPWTHKYGKVDTPDKFLKDSLLRDVRFLTFLRTYLLAKGNLKLWGMNIVITHILIPPNHGGPDPSSSRKNVFSLASDRNPYDEVLRPESGSTEFYIVSLEQATTAMQKKDHAPDNSLVVQGLNIIRPELYNALARQEYCSWRKDAPALAEREKSVLYGRKAIDVCDAMTSKVNVVEFQKCMRKSVDQMVAVADEAENHPIAPNDDMETEALTHWNSGSTDEG